MLRESIASLRMLAAGLDAAALTGAGAKRLVEQTAELERLAGAVRTLAAGRVAQTGAWIGPDGAFRDAGAWMASVAGTRAISDVEGLVEMRGPIDLTARFMAALEPIEADLFDQARAAGRREPPDALAFDAIIQMADESAEVATKASGNRVPATVIVRVDHAALVRGTTEPGETCEIAGIGPVPVPVARKLEGDDSILKVLVHDTTDVRAISQAAAPSPPGSAPHSRSSSPNAASRDATPTGTSRSTTTSPSPKADPPHSGTSPAPATTTTTTNTPTTSGSSAKAPAATSNPHPAQPTARHPFHTRTRCERVARGPV